MDIESEFHESFNEDEAVNYEDNEEFVIDNI